MMSLYVNDIVTHVDRYPNQIRRERIELGTLIIFVAETYDDSIYQMGMIVSVHSEDLKWGSKYWVWSKDEFVHVEEGAIRMVY